jgi:peptide methionine sulfoxide reductase msrA/msrB
MSRAARALLPRTPFLVALVAVVAIWAWKNGPRPADASDARAEAPAWKGAAAFEKPSDDELRKRLSDLQFQVTQEEGTEPAFRNEYWNNEDHGLYVDLVSGEPLFSSLDKYKSGTGWPSFVRPVRGVELGEATDYKLGYGRTELRSPVADSHLGHVFPDGPEPTGLRYCINSAALDFVPLTELESRGYAEYVSDFEEAGIEMPETEIALLAGGCYWGMEDLFRNRPGVVDTEVGFCGGETESPKYETLKGTGHAETLRIEYDPTRTSYAELLDFFFRIHDPTTVDRQGNDVGSTYRSAIFWLTEEQRRTAERVKAEWNESGRWGAPIVTEITKATKFWPAKESHQDYLEKHPNGYTCHFVRDFDT